MQKLEFNREIDKHLDYLFSNYLVHHTCQFFTKYSKTMKPFGSGVFAYLGGNYYILTASHVTERLDDNNSLYIKIHDGYVSVVGDVKGTEINKSNGIDLSYIRLDDRIIPDLKRAYKFIDISKFRRHIKLLDATHYCVVGFPEANLEIKDGKSMTGASIYLMQPCKEKVYDYYKFDLNTFFVLEFKGKGTDIKTGETKKIAGDFYGLSGCGLWFIIVNYNGKEYDLDYRLIGIMTEFRKGKYYCLIGNRIEIILNEISNTDGLKFKIKNHA